MSMLLNFCLYMACGLMVLLLSGCVASRTVKRDGAVVEQGLVVKGPLPYTSTGF